MKKTLLFLLSFSLLVPGALAATIFSDYSISLKRFETDTYGPVKITSTADNDITAEHGIRLMLEPAEQILWDDRPVTVTGSAVDNGKVNLNVQVEYAADYKSVVIPVMEDFESGEWINVHNLGLRAYDDDFSERKVMMDLDGDSEADVYDINTYEVDPESRTDRTVPYPVQDLEYEMNADGSVTFTWSAPPDYDYDLTAINRDRIKNGFSLLSLVYEGNNTTFTDSDLDGVTAATYYFTTLDWNGNESEEVQVGLDFVGEEEPTEPPVEEPTEPEEPPVAEPGEGEGADETEVEELSRLLNYYNVRYSIKCMPSGVSVPDNDSACLWARIDLVYAQELTGEVLVEDVSLTARDMELMASRRRWPEMRYDDNCVEASEPASYCPALGKALDRISYFLD